MCGILGFVDIEGELTFAQRKRLLNRLYRYSESRGQEASGIAIQSNEGLSVLKSTLPSSEFIASSPFQNKWAQISRPGPMAVIGHSRLVTNGAADRPENNQPVVHSDVVCVHNGIITNDSALWQQYQLQNRQGEVDSEVLSALVDRLFRTKDSTSTFAQLNEDLQGTASAAFLDGRGQTFSLYTNNGSIYYAQSASGKSLVFSSERSILEKALGKNKNLRKVFVAPKQLASRSHLHLSLNLPLGKTSIDIASHSPKEKKTAAHITKASPLRQDVWDEFFTQRRDLIHQLRRCTQCILPESMPFITFDSKGVCSYCRNHQPFAMKPRAELTEIAENLRTSAAHSPTIACFSGGRDSSFGLHYMVKELGLKPIAYSYDWGMLTDLGRRNQARMCGALGLEHILVSANIAKKRRNIKNNIIAWLKSPHLGTVPLFMAGDKQYFYYANKVMAENSAESVFMFANPYEKTDFKTGFCGVSPDFGEQSVYQLKRLKKLKLLWFYWGQFLNNPALFNSSMRDTFHAFHSYYFLNHDYVNLFDYVPWTETEINKVLLGSYEWETDSGFDSTWRIGDGTAAFYNYLYYILAGFTEHETLRSHQVRNGLLTREEAHRLALQENEPRWDSMAWYFSTIGLEMGPVIDRVNAITPSFLKG